MEPKTEEEYPAYLVAWEKAFGENVGGNDVGVGGTAIRYKPTKVKAASLNNLTKAKKKNNFKPVKSSKTKGK